MLAETAPPENVYIFQCLLEQHHTLVPASIIHEEALEIVRKTYPEADKVFDRYPVEAYFEDVWEYPGKWYYYVAVPQGAGGQESLIRTIVRDTKEYYRTGTIPPQYGPHQTC